METIGSGTDARAEIKKEKIFPDVLEKFPNGFPEGYRPWLDGWSFDLEKLKETLPDGTYKMLTLDVNITDEAYTERINKIIETRGIKALRKEGEKRPNCPHNCPTCFAVVDIENPLMTFEETVKVIEEGKKLGLETVKYLGPTELVLNPDLFKILDYFKGQNLKFSVFTKAAALGDDTLAQKYFQMPARDLCAKLATYPNLRLLINFESSDPATQQNRVGPGISDFSTKRNKAIENLVQAGLNSDEHNQRMALICAPVLKSNADEALEIFKWGTKRNIPVIIAPTMISGEGKNAPEVYDAVFKEETLVNLYYEIYSWMIDEGILTIEQVEKEGISPYAGYACNQFITGMFIRQDGVVRACPGNDSEDFRYFNDVRKADLKNVWTNGMGYKIRDELVKTGKLTVTQPCYAKTEGELVKAGSFTEDFYSKVLGKLKNKFKS